MHTFGFVCTKVVFARQRRLISREKLKFVQKKKKKKENLIF